MDRALAETEVRVETAELQRTEDLARGTARAFEDVEAQVRLTTAQYREAVALIGEGETATRAVARVTGQVAAEADDVEFAYRRVAASLDLSEDEARSLARSIALSTRESEELNQDLRRVAESLGLSSSEAALFSRRIREAESGVTGGTAAMSRGFDTVRGSVLRLGATLAAFVGVREIVRQLNQAVQASANLAESVNAVNVVFSRSADTVLDASEDAATRFGVSSRAFNEAATQLGASLQNAGFDAEEAADRFLELQLRATDTASVLNTDVNEVLIALQAALRGEFDPIERFTGGMNVAAVQAKALSLGLVAQGEELDANAKATATLALFMERTNRFAGDFANTSESVANRQRSLAADVENASGKLGDALIPAYERLLSLSPAVIEAMRQLSIAVAGAAESFAEGGESAASFADFLQALGAVPTAVGTLAGTTKGLFDILIGSVNVFDKDLDQVVRGFQQLNTTADAFDISQLRNRLIDVLQAGVDPAKALANVFVELGQLSLDEDQFANAAESFTAIANLPTDRLSDLALTLAAQGEAAGLTVEQVNALREALVPLATASTRAGGALLRALRPPDIDTGAITTFAQQITTITDLGQTAFASLTGFLDDAGISLTDFILAGAPIPGFLAQTRSEAELTGATFAITAAATRELASDLETRLGTAVPQLGSIFEGAAEQIKTSTDEIIANIREQVTQTAEFEANLAILAARGQEALAAALLEEGPAAATAAADFVKKPADAIEAEALLTGEVATAKAEEARSTLASALAEIDLSPEGRLVLLSFAEGLTDPAILGEILGATQTIADTTVGGLRGGLQAQSPSKLTMAIGEDAAEGFLLGFESRIRTPIIPTFNLPEQARISGGTGSQVNVTFTTTPNPTTDTARIVQTIGALVQ